MPTFSASGRGTTAAGTNTVNSQQDNLQAFAASIAVAANRQISITDVAFWCKGEAVLEIEQNNDVAGGGTWFHRKSINLPGNGQGGDTLDSPIEVNGNATDTGTTGNDVELRFRIIDTAGTNLYGFDIQGTSTT